mgnify:FL=1
MNYMRVIILFLTCAMVNSFIVDAVFASGDDSIIEIGTIATLYSPVLFDHELHVKYASCVECHHHTTGEEPSDPYCLPCHSGEKGIAQNSCNECHTNGSVDETESDTSVVTYHNDVPTLKGAYHLNCIDCHEGIGTGPIRCSGCHVLTGAGEKFYKTEKRDQEGGESK